MTNSAIYKLVMVIANKAFANAWLITAICLYSNGHWIEGTLSLALGIFIGITP